MRAAVVILVALVLALAIPASASSYLPTVYITGEETVDASNSKDKAKHLDFTTALTAAIHKKHVPVLVVTDETKAKFRIQHTRPTSPTRQGRGSRRWPLASEREDRLSPDQSP